MSRDLLRRLAWGLLLGTAIATLFWWVLVWTGNVERGPGPPRLPIDAVTLPAPADWPDATSADGGADSAGAAEGAGAAQKDPRQNVLPVVFPRVQAASIRLTADLEGLPPDYAPVAKIHRGGGVWLVRPIPPPSAPTARAAVRPAVVLPRATLAALTPPERVAFLEILGAWSGGALVEAGRLDLDPGLRAGPDELAAVLRWQR